MVSLETTSVVEASESYKRKSLLKVLGKQRDGSPQRLSFSVVSKVFFFLKEGYVCSWGDSSVAQQSNIFKVYLHPSFVLHKSRPQKMSGLSVWCFSAH